VSTSAEPSRAAVVPTCGPIGGDPIAATGATDLEPRRADRAAYERADTIRLRGDGLGLRIARQPDADAFSGPYLYRDPIDGAHVYTLYETGRRYRSPS